MARLWASLLPLLLTAALAATAGAAGLDAPIADAADPAATIASNASDADAREGRYLVAGWKSKRLKCWGQVGTRVAGGTCVEKGECALKRGTKIGHCPLLSTCCLLEYTCGQASHYKVTYFTSPTNVQPECDYRINIINRDVCQIRIDFERFTLSQPESEETYTADALGGWRCVRDRFQVEAPGSSGLGFEALCGENTGQHIYVPVNATAGPVAVRLSFRLAGSTSSSGLPGNATGVVTEPRWLLRVTQLECGAFDYDYSTVTAALASATLQTVNKHAIAATDAYLAAPPGCLQFYPEPSGYYMSFNYPGSRYLANLNYAICFRRRYGDCGIRHTVEQDTDFLIDYNPVNDTLQATQGYTDRFCDTLQDTGLTFASDDYLFVPNGLISSTLNGMTGGLVHADKICGMALQAGEAITSYAPGPPFVYFHSDSFAVRKNFQEERFRLRYDALSAGCLNNDPGTGTFAG